MFNVGPGELIVVALVLLIAVGPEQLPGLIRRAGVAMGQVKGMTDSLRSEFMSGIDEIERATDPGAWAASAGPSNVRPQPAKPAEPKDDAESNDAESSDPAPDDVAADGVAADGVASEDPAALESANADTDVANVAAVADAANAGIEDTVFDEPVNGSADEPADAPVDESVYESVHKPDGEVTQDELASADPELGETA